MPTHLTVLTRYGVVASLVGAACIGGFTAAPGALADSTVVPVVQLDPPEVVPQPSLDQDPFLPEPINPDAAQQTQWQTPQDSVRTDPARLAVRWGVQGQDATVLVLRAVEGRPQVERRRVTAARFAHQLRAWQRQPGVVAVGVDRRLAVAGDPPAPEPSGGSSQHQGQGWGPGGKPGAPPAPDDPLLVQQWQFDPRARYGTNLGAVRQASTGRDVTVALIDTGVDSRHPELADALLPGASIVHGVTTYDNQGVDVTGHGTHVAGIIAAATNNERGVASVAPGVRLLPVRVVGSAYSGAWEGDIAEGVMWAAMQGAQIINISMASTYASDVLGSAISFAQAMGATVVAAGGNGCLVSSVPIYPAAFEGVIGVGATAYRSTARRYSSCTGSWIDLAAPGESIVSTLRGGTYGSSSGTSMATPFVSASLAVLMSAAPRVSAGQHVLTLYATAHDWGAKGKDAEFGYGQVDVDEALRATLRP